MKVRYYKAGQDTMKEFAFIENDIIDLSNNGERWEGDSLDGLPHGFGVVYDSNNKLKYCGFMFEGLKIGFGEEYYENGEGIEYRGNFIKNKRHGEGVLYDMKNRVVFEGMWHFGDNTSQLTIPPNCNESALFTDCVKELVIENNCYNDLESLFIVDNCALERLDIRDRCFKMVN